MDPGLTSRSSLVKIAIFAIIALAVGIAAGVFTSYREFDGERVPTKMILAVLDEKSDVTAPNQGPKIVVEGGESFDFGTQDRGSKGKHDFEIRNIGNQPVVLKMIDKTCQCTVPAIDGKPIEKGDKITIEAGKSFTITLEWSIKVAQPNFSQSVEFSTDDPKREVLKLLIHGKTVEAIELSEGSLIFPATSASEPAAAELDILSHRDQNLKITKHVWQDESTASFFEVTFLPMSKDDVYKSAARGGVTMRVVVKPGLPLGMTRNMITVTTNYAGMDPQNIPVEIRIVGDISLLGPKVPENGTSVSLGTIEQNKGVVHTVYLNIKGAHRDATEVQIEKVEPESLRATLEAPLTDTPSVKRIPIRIEVPAGSPLGNFTGTDNSKRGRIVIKTTHPQIPEIVIPVYFLVR